MTGSTASIQVRLTTADGAVLTCSTNPVTAASGVAAYQGCKVDKAGSYTLTATSPGLADAVSSSFTITTGSASKLTFTTQPSGTATAGTEFGTQPAVTVQDAGGNTVTGSAASIVVGLTTAGGAVLTCTTNPVTAASGVATYQGCKVDKAGSYTLTATSTGLAAAVSTSFTITTGSASKLAFTTQPSGTATVLTVFGTQPVVTVQDAGGNTVTGSTASIQVGLTTASGAVLTCTSNSVTAASGVASYQGCKVDKAGSYTLTATSTGLADAVSSSFTITAGSASKLTITTQPSATAASGAAFGQQPVIQLRDTGENAVSQSSVVVTATISTGTGSLYGTATATTNGSGVASFSGLGLNGAAGSYKLTFTATAAGLTATPESSAITLSAGAATKLTITTQPSGTATAGAAFGTQPTVTVQDASGNTVSGDTSTVSLALTTPGGATLTCTGGNGKAATAGVATFAGCQIDKAGTYTLTATDGSLTLAVSTNVVVSAGAASKLVFTTQPSGTTTAGTAWGQQPVVTIQDASGNTVTGETSTVSLALTTPGGATLTCTGGNGKAATAGVATFAGCQIDKAGTYTLTATDGSLASAASTNVVVSAGAASKLTFTTQPSGGPAATAWTTQPVVTVEDSGGITVSGSSDSVTLAITAPGGATLTCTRNPVSAASGVAAFGGCRIDKAGTGYTLTATSGGGLTSATSGAFSVSLAPQETLVVQAAPTTVNVGSSSALSSAGGSGTGGVTYQVGSGPCSVSGSTLTGTDAGNCSVTATKAADATYASTTSAPVTVTVTVGLAPQSPLTLLASPTTVNVAGTSALSTVGGSGTGGVTYQVVSGPCSVGGATLTGADAGSCSVTAIKAADATYASATSVPVTVTVGLAPQSPLTLHASPTTVDVGGTGALSAAGGSGTGAVSYQLVSGPCSVSGSTLTGTGAGSCSVTATKAADAAFAAATSTPATVTVGLAPQSPLTLLASPTTVRVDATGTLSTTGGSGTGAVTYSLLGGPCSLSGSTLTGLQRGSCTVTATKAADAAFAQATSAPVTVTVELAPQMALAVVPSPTTVAAGGTSTLSTTGGSGTGAVTYSLVSGPCSLSGATLTALRKGSCWVTGTKAADATYAQATSAPVTVTVELIPQPPLVARSDPSMLILGPGTTRAGEGNSGTGRFLHANPGSDSTLSAAGGSGTGQVVYTLLGGPCRVDGSILTGLDSGSCLVFATREADEVYAQATSEPVTVTVGTVPQSALVLLADPSTVAVRGTGTLLATGGSGTGAVSYALVGGPCALSGATFTGIAAGSCSFKATKTVDVTYAATTSSPVTITVSQNPQSTLTLVASPGQIAANGTSALVATGGSGSGAVTFSLTGGPCSLSGSTLTGLRAGPCTVSATKAADGAFAEASAAPVGVTVSLAPQAALVATASSASIPVTGTSSLASTGGAGTGAVTFALAGGPCSLSGSTLTGLASGSCVFTATKAADATYAQVTSAPATVNVGLSQQATLVLTATPSAIQTLDSSLLATTGGSGSGLVSFSLSSGSCSIAGHGLTGLSSGSCVVTAAKASDGVYAPAASAPVTVTVGLAPQATLVLAASPTMIAVNGTSALSTAGGSGAGAVTYAVASGPCSVGGGTLRGTGAGTCSVTASKASDGVFAAATATPVAVTVLATEVSGETPGGWVTATITGGTCLGFGSAQFSMPSPLPAGGTFPYGVFGFTVLECGTGATPGWVGITMTFPRDLPFQDTSYLKLLGGAWQDWTRKVVISGNKVTLIIQDGGEGDINPRQGEITDPSGPFVGTPVTAAIPTLSEWGLLLHALVLLGTGLVCLRRLPGDG